MSNEAAFFGSFAVAVLSPRTALDLKRDGDPVGNEDSAQTTRPSRAKAAIGPVPIR
jgi:hypothetical protein